MFDIHVADTNITGGSIPISWCVHPCAIKNLTNMFGENPQVVIVVAPIKNYDITKEVRKVVPLRDLMTYVDFKVRGPNRIWAFIANQSDKNLYLTKSYSYICNILNIDGNGWGYRWHKTLIDEAGDEKDVQEPSACSTLDINVPDEAFAPEPFAWEKEWVNHFFNNKSNDQCHFRRRRLFAYTIQPVLMFLQMQFRLLVTLMALLIGSKNFSLKPLLHPLAYDLDSQINILGGGSIFIKNIEPFNKTSDFNQILKWWLRKYYLIIFMPLTGIILGLLTYLIIINPLVVISVIGSICVVITLLVSLMLGFHKNIWAKIESLNKIENEEELCYLTCSPEKTPFTIKNMPFKKKTIKLRYQDLKSKICKPFSA